MWVKSAVVIAASLVSATAYAEEDKQDDNQSEGIVVIGKRDKGYVSDVATAPLRIDTKVLETPLSISAVSDKLLADRGLTDLNRAGDTVAGVQRQGGAGYPFSTSYVIRGFRTDGAASTINGFREFGFATARDPINIERVEFLKGPASVLYGSSFALAGLVNYVTKTPVDETFAEISGQVGDIDLRRLTIDANLTDREKRGGLRVTGAIGREGQLSAFRDKSYRFGSAVGTWQLAPTLKGLLEVYVFDGDTAGRDGDGLYPDAVFLAVPRDFKPGERFSRGEQKSWGGRAELEWALAPATSLRTSAFYNRASQNYVGTRPDASDPVSADGRFLNRTASRGSDLQEDVTLLSELRTTQELAGMRHKLLIGASYSDYDFGPYEFFDAPLAPLEIANPVYGAALPTPDQFISNYPAQSYGARSLAFYMQDFVELGEQVRVLAGLRYDRVKSRYEDVNEVFNQQTESAWSPRLGFVYLPVPQLSLYASWSKSFVPNSFGRAATGELFASEQGEQAEAGVKAELLDGRLFATLATFELKRRNILTADPTDPNFSIAVGEQRSRGVEFEVQGSPFSGLQLTAAYTYTDAKVTRDNDTALVGDQLQLAARHVGSIWARYDRQIAADWSAGVGGGVFSSSARQASLPNNGLTLPGYARVDGSLYLSRGNRLRLQVNIDNLFDKRIIDSGGFFLVPQPGRTVRAGVTVGF